MLEQCKHCVLPVDHNILGHDGRKQRPAFISPFPIAASTRNIN